MFPFNFWESLAARHSEKALYINLILIGAIGLLASIGCFSSKLILPELQLTYFMVKLEDWHLALCNALAEQH